MRYNYDSLKRFACFFSVLYCLSVFSVSAQVNEINLINDTIQNHVTGGHVNIPGTRIYIEPPNGYTALSNGNGFIGNNSKIDFIDNIGRNYNIDSSSFNKKLMNKANLYFLDSKSITVSGYTGKLILADAPQNIRIYFIQFGDSTFSTMITSYFFKGDSNSLYSLAKSINSIYYDINTKVNPLDAITFSLGDSLSKLKYIGQNEMFYTYTFEGLSEPQYADIPTFRVAQLWNDQRQSARSFAKILQENNPYTPYQEYSIIDSSTERISIYDSYQFTYSYKSANSTKIVYCCIISTADYIYWMEGYTAVELDVTSQLSIFKDFAHTFHKINYLH